MSYSISEILEYRAIHEPHLVALQDPVASMTYSQWHVQSLDIATLLCAHKIRYQELVALEADRKHFIYSSAVYIAIIRLGAIPLVVPENIAVEEKEYAYKKCNIDTVIKVHENSNISVEHRNRSVYASKQLKISQGRVSEILFSSGTTGVPKLIACPMDEITYMWDSSPIRTGTRGIEVHGAVWGTNYSQEIVRSSILWGSHIFTPRSIDGKGILEAIIEYGADTLRLTPPLAHALTRVMSDTTILQVRHISVSSAASTPDLLRKLERHFPNAEIINQYSATESGRSRLELVWGKDPADVLGKPQDETEVRINTDNHRLVLDDGVVAGEIELRHKEAPSRFVVSSERISSGSWVPTGDLGYMRDDGYVVLVDRITDIINCGGRKISPIYLESLIRNTPNIQDVLVCGIPHPTLGESIGMLVSKADADSPLTFNAEISNYPIQKIKTVDSIPLTRAGKPDRRAARAMLLSSDYCSQDGELKKNEKEDDKDACKILEGIIPHASSNRQSSWVAAGGDSLSSVELIDVLSTDYNIEIEESLFDSEHCIQDIIAYISKHLKEE